MYFASTLQLRDLRSALRLHFQLFLLKLDFLPYGSQCCQRAFLELLSGSIHGSLLTFQRRQELVTLGVQVGALLCEHSTCACGQLLLLAG